MTALREKLKGNISLERQNMQEKMAQEEAEEAKKGWDIREYILDKVKTEIEVWLVENKPDLTAKVDAIISEEIDSLRSSDMKRGYKGEPGPQGPKPTDEELLAIIKPLIKTPKDGKTPTEAQLLSLIKPLIPKATKPISREQIIDIAKSVLPKQKKPEDIVRDINNSKVKIKPEQVDGLIDAVNKKGGSKGGGGGMGNWVHEVFAVSSATTTVTIANRVAANSNAVLVRYNGQLLDHGVQYTIADKIISFTFTLDDDSSVGVTYVRT